MQVRARVARSLVLALALVAVAALPAIATDQDVTIEGFAFSPGRVTVMVGDTVTWTNRDGASHTATADDGSWDTGGIPSSSSASIRFTKAGEFRYSCAIHPDMTGRVIVLQAASGESGSAPPATDLAPDRPTEPSPPLPALAFALLAGAALSGALGWHRRVARRA